MKGENSMRNHVFVTRPLPGSSLDLLKPEVKLDVFTGPFPITPLTLIKEFAEADGVICLLNDTIDATILESSPKLRIVSCYSVGFNNVDIERATALGIVVTNTPGILTETTADLAWALLMSTARRVCEGDIFMRNGKFKGWDPGLLLGTDIHGKVLGIVGLGRIGSAVARRASAFDMKVVYSDPTKDLTESLHFATRVSFSTLLSESDFISIHAPLNKSTKNLFGENEFTAMKKTAILINTARGEIVDETMLVKALHNGEITGAGLDVYEREPEITEKLLTLKNCVLLPHLGSATLETRSRMADLAVRNILDFLQGKMPQYVVNPEVFKKKTFQSRNPFWE